MKAAIYARYSSENQRPESIEDQIGACRRLARERSVAVLDDHIYTDEARSGARKDRPGLEACFPQRHVPSSTLFSSMTCRDWRATTT